MNLIDTDTFTLMARPSGQDARRVLMERIELNRDSVFLCTVTAEEVLRGALALIRKEETRGKGTEGYRLLRMLLVALNDYPMLDYDDEADRLYRSFPAAVKRNGSADCKIAAVAQIHQATVITRNSRHFSEIPNTAWEDWTQ